MKIKWIQIIEQNKILKSIREGLMLTMPLLIIGSFFLILINIPFEFYTVFMTNLLSNSWKEVLIIPVNMTYGIMGIVALLGITYQFSKNYNLDKISTIMISISCFFISIPMVSINTIDMKYLGSEGVFVAIFISIIVAKISLFCKSNNFLIKMPKQVPEIVGITFSSLIPFFISITFFFTLTLFFKIKLNNSLFEITFFLLSIPLLKVGNSFIGMITVVFLINGLMVIGIHGASLVLGIMTPIYNILLDQNRIAYQLGEYPPNIVIPQFFNIFMGMGGAGNTLAFSVLLLFSKSKQLKNYSKLSLIPSLFNINEILIYGLPIVMNPILIIPFLLAPLISCSIAYLFICLKLIDPLPGIATPWVTPTIIDSFLSTNGDLKIVLFQICCFLLSVLIYYPFFKNYDKQICLEEKLNE